MNKGLSVQPEQMARRDRRAIPAQLVLRVPPVRRVLQARRDRLVQQALRVWQERLARLGRLALLARLALRERRCTS